MRRRIKYESRNEYKCFIESAEQSIKVDPKSFWSYVNTKRKKSRILGTLTDGNNILKSPQDIVEAFAQQFVAVFGDNSSCDKFCNNTVNCIYCDKKFCPSVNIKSSCDLPTTLHKIKIASSDILLAVKKIKDNYVSGPDKVPAFVVVDCINCFLSPLRQIFNLILKYSLYPNVWSVSKVVPVFKSGNKTRLQTIDL